MLQKESSDLDKALVEMAIRSVFAILTWRFGLNVALFLDLNGAVLSAERNKRHL